MITTINEWAAHLIKEENSQRKDLTALANDKGISEDAVLLLTYWGLRGYLYYNSLPDRPILMGNKEFALKKLRMLFDSKWDGSYSKHARNDIHIWNDPSFIEENVHKYLTKPYFDDTLRANMVAVKEPMVVAKDYTKSRGKLEDSMRWFSFSLGLESNLGSYGEDYVEYVLPVGFKYVDASGIAEDDEILIWGPDLKDAEKIRDEPADDIIKKKLLKNKMS